MKKLGVCLMIVMAALMFFGCETDDNPPDNNNVTVTGVTLNKTTLTLEVGKNERLIATVTPNNADNPEVKWSSDNVNVAYVNGGLVYAEAVGTATITVTTEDGGHTDACTVTVTAATSNYVVVEGDTLIHHLPGLLGGSGYGNTDKITNNEDGSATFTGTEDQNTWNGGGVDYTFPSRRAGETWNLSDYDLVEVHLIVTEGSVSTVAKKLNNVEQINLYPYPSPTPLANSVTFNSATAEGVVVFKTVIGEGGGGVGFQRNGGGPATIGITKVIFSKGTMRTIKFEGGDYTTMPAIADIKIPDGRTVNFGDSYAMPLRPTRDGYTFTGWYNTTDSSVFDESAAITKDITLTAQWEAGAPPEVDMKLNLDPSTWGTLPQNAANQSGSWTWPSGYATTAYENGVLTLTFSGMNRQRAIIPLSTAQIDELMNATGGVTFRIVGEVKGADGNVSAAEFRLHLGNPSGTASWNGTDTGEQGALKDHLVEYRPFSSNKSRTTLGWFMIQAMYWDNATGTDTVQSGFPAVIITIESITIDIGDTR